MLKEHYATKRTFDFYVCATFNSRQAKHETAAASCSRLDQSVSDFRVAAVAGCAATNFVSQLGKAFFIQGLASERIQIIVRSRNPSYNTEASEIGTEEERVMLSATEKSLLAFHPNDSRSCKRVANQEPPCFLPGGWKEVKAILHVSVGRRVGENADISQMVGEPKFVEVGNTEVPRIACS